MKPSIARAIALACLALSLDAAAQKAPGPTEINGQRVLTFVGRDPPGQRCNNNIRVAAEVANVYRVPIQVVPAGVAGPAVPAPAVYYGGQVIAADGGLHNGVVSYQIVADALELEGTPKHAKSGRLFEQSVRGDFDQLKRAIRGAK